MFLRQIRGHNIRFFSGFLKEPVIFIRNLLASRSEPFLYKSIKAVQAFLPGYYFGEIGVYNRFSQVVPLVNNFSAYGQLEIIYFLPYRMAFTGIIIFRPVCANAVCLIPVFRQEYITVIYAPGDIRCLFRGLGNPIHQFIMFSLNPVIIKH